MVLVQNNRALICVNCQKVYSHKQSLVRHEKHCKGQEQTTDPKPDKSYECESCQKQFAYRASLYNHRRFCKGNVGANTSGDYLHDFAHLNRNVENLRSDLAVLQEKDKKLSRELKALQKRVKIKEKAIQKGLRAEPVGDSQIRKKFEQLSGRMCRVRRVRTWKYAIASFGGREQAMRGLIDLVCRQLTKEEVMLKYPYLFGTKATSCVLKLIHLREQKIISKREKFSKENYRRCVAYMFSAGSIISFNKWWSIVAADRQIKVRGNMCPIPLYPYDKLRRRVFSECKIQERVRNVSEILPGGFKCDSFCAAEGKYRPLDDAFVCLAEKLLQYESEPFLENLDGTFHFILCADGFPQGTNPGVDFTVSLAEFRSKIHSPNNCLLIMAANWKEDDEVCGIYLRYLVSKIKEIEQQSYLVNYQCGGESVSKTVYFKLAFFSGDQKWLATHLGELSCSATYFSPYCNVRRGECKNTAGSVGPALSMATWQEWSLEHRNSVPGKLAKLIQEFNEKNNGKEPSRSWVTEQLRERFQSRQEKPSNLGIYSLLIELCALHVSLNGWHDLFADFLVKFVSIEICPPSSNVHKFQSLACDHPFVIIAEILKNAGGGRLVAKLTSMWNEKAKSLDYRFRGLEVSLMCRTFHKITESLLPRIAKGDNPKLREGKMKKLCFFHTADALLTEIM